MHIQSWSLTVQPTDILKGVCDAIAVSAAIAALVAGYFVRFEISLIAGSVSLLAGLGSIYLRIPTSLDLRIERLSNRLKAPMKPDLKGALQQLHQDIEEGIDLLNVVEDAKQVKKLREIYNEALKRNEGLNDRLKTLLDYKYSSSQIRQSIKNLMVIEA